MKKSFLVIFSCLVCVVSFQAFTIHREPAWKNLKILPQDISKDGLDSVMHHFTASLGVKCNYCHAGNPAEHKMDFPSDEKPEKQIARKMMLMSIDINKNHFQQIADMMKDDNEATPVSTDTAAVTYMLKYVTCYTCHHGDAHPKNKPPKNMDQNRPPMPPAPPAPPTQNKQ